MKTTYNPTKNAKKKESHFKISLPAESCGMLRRGWKPEEIISIRVTVKKQDSAENGNVAAVILDNEQTARLVEYTVNSVGEIVLIDPNNYCHPFAEGEAPIVLSKEAAEKRLKIIGVVQKFALRLKN